MGGETSRLSGANPGLSQFPIQLPSEPSEERCGWSHFHATLPEATPPYETVSVFRSESPSPPGTPPLDKCAQNLMKYRHPNILKYIWHWQQRGYYYLATEPVKSLSRVLSSQEPLQICVGLNQIVQALDFLHNKAFQSHNNVCIDSIYVTSDGSWKLGGMELLQPFSEMNRSYLKQIKPYRNDDYIDDDEESADDFTKIDQFAFSNLVQLVFKGKCEDDIPHLNSFYNYCNQDLQNQTASLRSNFSSILQHDFFNHDFILIHKFLMSLPVKTESEKQTFFSNLLEKLRNFNEETVSRLFAIPLLSRLVLLDMTAREKLLPSVLVPKDESSVKSKGLFSLKIFKQHITPQLIKMFKVRDSQVRLLLLKYFNGYMMTFDEHDLTTFILPDLLLGIKDIDDTIVSMTLYCLADLIPVLGASTVIGAKRCKLFTDGRPLLHKKTEIVKTQKREEYISINDKMKEVSIKPETEVKAFDTSERKISIELSTANTCNSDSNLNSLIKEENIFGSRESIETDTNLFLHERPSPDGGEDLDSEVVQNPVDDHLEDSDENWSDWEDNGNKSDNDTNNYNEINDNTIESLVKNGVESINNVINETEIKVDRSDKEPSNQNSLLLKKNTMFLQKAAMDAKMKKLTDISELDIKNQIYTPPKSGKAAQKDEFDFFTDMEPVIEKANTYTITDASVIKPLNDSALKSISHELESDQRISAKLSFTPIDNDNTNVDNNAWGDIDWDED